MRIRPPNRMSRGAAVDLLRKALEQLEKTSAVGAGFDSRPTQKEIKEWLALYDGPVNK